MNGELHIYPATAIVVVLLSNLDPPAASLTPGERVSLLTFSRRKRSFKDDPGCPD